jgi:hypothetical protein
MVNNWGTYLLMIMQSDYSKVTAQRRLLMGCLRDVENAFSLVVLDQQSWIRWAIKLYKHIKECGKQLGDISPYDQEVRVFQSNRSTKPSNGVFARKVENAFSLVVLDQQSRFRWATNWYKFIWERGKQPGWFTVRLSPVGRPLSHFYFREASRLRSGGGNSAAFFVQSGISVYNSFFVYFSFFLLTFFRRKLLKWAIFFFRTSSSLSSPSDPSKQSIRQLAYEISSACYSRRYIFSPSLPLLRKTLGFARLILFSSSIFFLRRRARRFVFAYVGTQVLFPRCAYIIIFKIFIIEFLMKILSSLKSYHRGSRQDAVSKLLHEIDVSQCPNSTEVRSSFLSCSHRTHAILFQFNNVSVRGYLIIMLPLWDRLPLRLVHLVLATTWRTRGALSIDNSSSVWPKTIWRDPPPVASIPDL